MNDPVIRNPVMRESFGMAAAVRDAATGDAASGDAASGDTGAGRSAAASRQVGLGNREGFVTAEDLGRLVPAPQLGVPGEYPFTRGIHRSMYRGRLWTMRQFSGFGTARHTNERFRFLLAQGQSGLSTAFDLPTLMGLDSDDPRSAGEVGRLGVAVDTIEDMLVLFEGIPLQDVSVSMTINAPAAIVMALYLAAAEERGIDWKTLRGTIQNDILKEFHAQNEVVYPPAPSVRLVVDLIEFGSHSVPQWNTVSISGYHIREAGATALQELAFTLADGRHYVEETCRRGLGVDAFAGRLSFFFNAHNDFFEEIAKYRAARRLWAELMRDEYGAQNPNSWKLRFHAQTAGCSLQSQQPEVNVVRVAYQAMAAVLGGCQSLHTNSLDETLALPTEHAATLALRTQQVLAHETGVAEHVDPLGGSFLTETMTQQMYLGARDYFRRIADVGGMSGAIETGYIRREIAESAYRDQQRFDRGEQVIVGVNRFQSHDEDSTEILSIDPQVESDQLESLRAIRARRSNEEVSRSLDAIRSVAAGSENVMPALVAAARARVTVGEMSKALGDVFGVYRFQEQ
ncbi:acyl-CoA mutase large subunit family protein [Schlesneria paludicola]|uniref:acyl-CoA mutase large subunit family protein n=1 Tax=Schlesneria paludicola TaxID=360056 RepID=UPI00029A8D4F|nr:methylmalonyl-CoA mutase family protein [Schlesneria paludicola]